MRIVLGLALSAVIALLALLSEICLGAEPAALAALDKAFDEDAAAVPHVEVPIEINAAEVVVEGKPLTSVVVTQCNLIVAVYVTMPDGRLQRFDKTSRLGADQLLALAYTAVRSERVEVSCNSEGVVGYERHDPL